MKSGGVMTAIVPTSRVPPGHYGFRQAARMEWIKLRTLRSVKWALLVALAGMAGMGIAAGFNTRNAHGDVTNNILAGGALVFAAPLFGLAQTGAGKSCPGSSTRTRWALPSRRRGAPVPRGRAGRRLPPSPVPPLRLPRARCP